MEKADALVSIIIPTFNRGHLIEQTVQSVFSQTFQNWEIIIVDDGSVDNTQEVVYPFLTDERVKYCHRPADRPGGGNAARNYGYELARGTFIKWLDSDDLLLPSCLEHQIKQISSDEVDVVFGKSRWFSKDKTTNKIIHGKLWHESVIKSKNILEDFILGKTRFSNNDGLWRKSCLGKYPYHERLRNSQEFQMIINMLSKGIKITVMDEVQTLIRSHDSQMAAKRSYASYAHHQILARTLVLESLNKQGLLNNKIYYYLFKSNIYYTLNQTKKREFLYLKNNLKLLKKNLHLLKYSKK